MSLIASISGVRGTIGGQPGDNLTPIDVVKFAAAYGTWLKRQNLGNTVVLGRDARVSGSMVRSLVAATLQGLGIHVVDLDLTTTPTVEVAVPMEKAAGGIILTASHNPAQWNALKLLNSRGEFLSGADGEAILALYKSQEFTFAPYNELGCYRLDSSYLQKHIDAILALKLVNRDAIARKGFKVVVDAVNSTGGIYMPALLKALGVTEVVELNCEPTGIFAHNPEPLRQHLDQICTYIQQNPGYIGVVVDPDVDRLVFVCEDGELFGEEYTLVLVADYVLSQTPGAATVSNLSSSRALADIAAKHGGTYHAAAVGEVNVVVKMKANNAPIGGEGNGGIIYPELHYGRDSLVGVALALTHLANTGKTLRQLRDEYPNYEMAKHKVELRPGLDVDAILDAMAAHFASHRVNREDGVKVDLPDSWIHLRKSNTEPIIRIYTEAATAEKAQALAEEVHGLITAVAPAN